MNDSGEHARRPVKARGLTAMHRLAGAFAGLGITPNAVSMASVLFSAGAGALFVWTDRLGAGAPLQRAAMIGAALLIAFRLVANLLDGLIAVECGKRTPLGGVFNELPDRLSDVLVLVGFGYAAGGMPATGYLAAIVAVLIAYVRELGHGLGARHHFTGPMAKQQRMTVVIAASCWLGCTPATWRPESSGYALGVPAVACVIIIAMGLITLARRLGRIAGDLRAADGSPGGVP